MYVRIEMAKGGDTPVSSHSLSTSITLKPTERREEGSLDRNKAERGGNGGTQHAEELSAILFYLSRLPLDRVHRFLTLASPLGAVVPAGTEPVSTYAYTPTSTSV